MSIWFSLAEKTLNRCDQLATLSQSDKYIDRRYLTTEHKKANDQVAVWMREAGMRTWQDEAGNQWGRYTSPLPNAKTLVMGSHLDTVPNSGKYDGILGVLAPISLIEYLHKQGIALPFHLDVVGFGDEEGTRFGATLLGSRAVAGTWQDKWATIKDVDQICMAQAMRDFSLDINKIANASRQHDDLIGFVELHIEQGPVLEAKNTAVGVVTGIAGAKRYQVELKGFAGHAGTVPMAMRQDALACASEMILAIEQLAKKEQLVATVGKINCTPNGVNVIAGSVNFSIDIRSLDDQQLAAVSDALLAQLKGIAHTRNIAIEINKTHDAHAVACDESLQKQLAKAIAEDGQEAIFLPSGAGHDAMAMASLCPVAMLFMRCERGISHHPAEAVLNVDVAEAIKTLYSFTTGLHGTVATSQTA